MVLRPFPIVSRRHLMRKTLLVALAFTALALRPGKASDPQEPAPAAERYEVVLFKQNVMVAMRDGVKLATDIYRPSASGAPIETPLPLLLQRTPYNKEGKQLVEQATVLASHGYVVALQDDRGTYHSEGVQVKYIGYGVDGFDT